MAWDIPRLGPPRHNVFKPSLTCISTDDPPPDPPSTPAIPASDAPTRPDESNHRGFGYRVPLAGTERHRPAPDVTRSLSSHRRLSDRVVPVAPSPRCSGCSGRLVGWSVRRLPRLGWFGRLVDGRVRSLDCSGCSARLGGSVASVGLGQPAFTAVIAIVIPAVAATPDRAHHDQASTRITRRYQRRRA